MKKLLAILVACLMPICLIAGSGDVNGDGKIDVADIVELLNHLNGNPTKNYTASEADVNNDGVVDNNDAKALATIILSSEPILVSGQIQIENDKLKSKLDNSVVCTVSEESDINNGQFEIEVNQTDYVQTFFVTQEDKIYMISRQPVNDGRDVVFSIESTAIGFASLHPILSSLTKDDFNILVSKIKTSSYYPSFYSEIEKLINNNLDLFDENNSALFNAFDLLFDDVFNDFVQSDNQNYDLVNGTRSKTRAMEHPESFFPLHVQSYGNILKVSTTGLFPSYYGTVTTSNGFVYDFNVLAADDWGLKEFLTQDVPRYGVPSEFVFINEGEYHFDFSRINAEATYDFWYRIARLALSSLGVPVAKLNSVNSQIIGTIVNTISSTLGAGNDNLSPGEMFRIVLTTCCDVLEHDFLDVNLAERRAYDRLLKLNNIRNYTKFLSKVVGGYGIVHAATNAFHRIFSANQAPEEIKFCLCYYHDDVYDCVDANLIKISGDEQKGEPNETLAEPLKVWVQMIDENEYYHDPSPFHMVKFEVISGGGSVETENYYLGNDRYAQSNWTLGKSGEQIVRAVIVDKITNNEICEPVYFTASIDNDPKPITGEANNITKNSAVLSCSFEKVPDGAICYVYLEHDKESSLNQKFYLSPGNNQEVYCSNLYPSTLYCYTAVIEYQGNRYNGTRKSFWTEDGNKEPDISGTWKGETYHETFTLTLTSDGQVSSVEDNPAWVMVDGYWTSGSNGHVYIRINKTDEASVYWYGYVNDIDNPTRITGYQNFSFGYGGWEREVVLDKQ